jgi:hypothetical protein
VRWKAGNRFGRTDIIDLSPIVNSFKYYRQIRDESTFRTLHLIDDGFAVGWLNDKVEMASTSIERLAEETLTSADFRKFIELNNLTHAEAAAILGRSRRQIENYLSGDEEIPRVVALACFGFVARKHMRVFSLTGIGVQYQPLIDDVLTVTEPSPKEESLAISTETRAAPDAITSSE